MTPLALVLLAACAPPVRPECTTAHLHDVGDISSYAHCEALTGDLVLTCPPDAIEDLSGMEGLARVDGDVSLQCDSLVDLGGLSGLEEVGGLVLLRASRADTLAGLEALGAAGGLVLQYNGDLWDLSPAGAADGLALVQVEGNDAMFDLAGLEVGEVGEAVRIWDNASLGSLEGLGLTRTGSVSVRDNGLLASLEGLEDLEQVDEDLEIEASPELASLDGLSPALVVQGRVRLLDLTGLTEVGALGGASVHNLVISGAQRLESLTGLEGWSELTGGLTLAHDPALAGLDGLSGLRSTGGSLVLEDLPSLSSVRGLASLQEVQGDLTVIDNPALDQCDVEAWAAAVEVAGVIRIQDNGPCEGP